MLMSHLLLFAGALTLAYFTIRSSISPSVFRTDRTDRPTHDLFSPVLATHIFRLIEDERGQIHSLVVRTF